MVTRSYDIAIDGIPFMFGKDGGIELGNTLKEPSAPAQIDTVVIESLHHGAGRLLATDPYAYRDTNGRTVGADARLPGHIMPGGQWNRISQTAITNASDVTNMEAYAAAFTTDVGDVVFGAGRNVITVDVSNGDSVTSAVANMATGHYFTGSTVIWNRDAWLGVQDVNYETAGAWKYDNNTETTNTNYTHSWATSTRNGIFWIRNRDAANVPEFRWSDDTDSDFGSFSFDANTGQAYGPFYLEIEKAHVTGMVSVGPYALFANRGGGIWGFDRNEVFLPLTPFDPGGFSDRQFGGPMQYVGNWVMVPSVDGMKRFDPRSAAMVDITPSVHQGSSPSVANQTILSVTKRAQAIASTPSGAVVVTPFVGNSVNVLYLEMYEDGMFYHIAVANSGMSRAQAAIVTREQTNTGSYTPQQSAYVIEMNESNSNWDVYKLDMPTASWQPGPDNIATLSGLRTARYAGRPPDVSVLPTQARLAWVEADTDNWVDVWLEVDNEPVQVYLGRVTQTGPATLPVPADVLPCRRFSLAFDIGYNNSSSSVIPFVTMPINLDYRYAPVQSDAEFSADFITVKFEATSEQVNHRSGFHFGHGASRAEWTMSKRGQVIKLDLADRADPWVVVVEDAVAEQIRKQDGRTSSTYLVTLACRRLA